MKIEVSKEMLLAVIEKAAEAAFNGFCSVEIWEEASDPLKAKWRRISSNALSVVLVVKK